MGCGWIIAGIARPPASLPPVSRTGATRLHHAASHRRARMDTHLAVFSARTIVRWGFAGSGGGGRGQVSRRAVHVRWLLCHYIVRPPRVWLERQGASRMTKGGTSSTAAVTGPTLLIDDLFCPSNTLRYRGGAGRLTTGPLWARLHVGLFLASTISLSCGGNTQRTLFAHLMNGSGSSKSLSDACSRAVRRPETPALRFALSAGRRALIARAGVLISASCREPYRPPAPVARAAQDCVRRAF